VKHYFAHTCTCLLNVLHRVENSIYDEPDKTCYTGALTPGIQGLRKVMGPSVVRNRENRLEEILLCGILRRRLSATTANSSAQTGTANLPVGRLFKEDKTRQASSDTRPSAFLNGNSPLHDAENQRSHARADACVLFLPFASNLPTPSTPVTDIPDPDSTMKDNRF